MEKATARRITIDLNQFKLHITLNSTKLTLLFNSPSRRFYLSVITLVVREMQRQGKITSIPLKGHHELLALLNDTVGGSAGSSEKENLLSRIYKKWQYALPKLEEAQLFTILGRKKGHEEGVGIAYPFTEAEQDMWANLFEYEGSHEYVRLKFAIDKIGVALNDVVITYEDSSNGDAWVRFISSLKEREGKEQNGASGTRVPEEPEVPPLEKTKRVLLAGKYRWVALAAVVMIVLGALTLATWKIRAKPDPGDVASVSKMAFPLPDVPSFAVLPFANMTGDPKQAFLSDGITEAIITALSRIPGVFVIARSSTDTYKGKTVKVKQVSEELGVRYVLEGSVQRSGDRLRITAQLIDALKGYHLWANRYDRDLKDLFAVQDEIVVNVLANLETKLLPSRAFGGEGTVYKYYRGKQGLDCYLKLREGMGRLDRFNIQDNNAARRLIEEAIQMCPKNPQGYQFLGWLYHQDYMLGNTKSPRETLEKGMQLARKALAMDESPGTHVLSCRFYLLRRDYDKAIAEGQRAMAIDPSGLSAISSYALCLSFSGRSEEAITLLQRAIRRDPFGPSLYTNLGVALQHAGRLEEAVAANKRAIHIAPDNIVAHINQATVYSLMGREAEARAEAAEVLRINSKFSLDYWYAHSMLTKDRSLRERNVRALRKAGLEYRNTRLRAS